MARICLVTPGQPSSNPRLVKEADALVEAGHDVSVIAARWSGWADCYDQALLARRTWTCNYVGGHPTADRVPFLLTRARHRLARRGTYLPGAAQTLTRWAASRVLPELERAAKRAPADLYIGHTHGALPAVVEAAGMHGVPAGFDCEDYLPGTEPRGTTPSGDVEVVVRLERAYLPRCDYVTAASPGIGDSYASAYGIPIAASILNVFPLSQRPPRIQQTAEGGPLKLYWTSQTIGPRRGLEDAVRAMGIARRDITLYLRGVWTPGYHDTLARLATSCGVARERIVGLPLEPSDDMIRGASVYDIGLALEQPDSVNRDVCLTNKIFTYILAGNALILTATRAQRQIAETLGSGAFCYRPGDVDALATQLQLWHDDRGALRDARRTAWDWGTRRFNWDIEKAKLLQVVDGVLSA